MIEDFLNSITEPAEGPQPFTFATVGSVYSDGVTLIFPGEGESVKRYSVNQFCKFAAGQKVAVQKDSGTYVVMFPIGPPKQVVADVASTVYNMNTAYPSLQFRYSVQGQIDVKNSAGTNWTRLTGTVVSG